MNKGSKGSVICLAGIAAVLVFMGAFLLGIGVQQFLENNQILSEYRQSDLLWKQELAEGADMDVVRDMRNQELSENMKYLSIEREIHMKSAKDKGNASISNDRRSSYGCTVTLYRDATGEMVYQSGLIEPGYYIETIELSGGLKKGYYPCTAVWSFYTEHEEYAGETAWKIVMIIEN